MNIKNALALILVLFPLPLLAEDALTIDESTVDFGEQFQFTELKRDVTIWNRSDTAVQVSTANKDDAKTFRIEPTLIEPHASATVHIDIPLADHLGYFGRRYQIIADRKGTQERYPLLVTGFVDSVLDDPNPGVDFGLVDATEPKDSRTLTLSSSAEPALSIAKVLDAPEFIDAHRGRTLNELVLTPKPSNFLGFRKGVIKLGLDNKKQSEVWVNTIVEFRGDFVADQNPLSFGVQRSGSLRPVRLQIKSRDGAPFAVAKVTVDPISHVTAKSADCIPKAMPDCHAYVFEIDKSRHQGQIAGSATFEFTHSEQILNVLFEGIFLLDETKVQSINEMNSSRQSVSKSKVDLSTAISSAVSEASELEPAGKGPLLKWKVANENGMYGYAIFRGDTADGSFARVNAAIIRAKDKGDNAEASYQYRDNTAQAGKEYWYYITIFYNNGKKVQLTGPQKVLAK